MWSPWCRKTLRAFLHQGAQPTFAQAMIRVRDADKTITFYGSRGLAHIATVPVPEFDFTLHFLAAVGDAERPPAGADRKAVAKWLFSRPYPTLELTHNALGEGEKAEEYVSGDEAPRGFAGIAPGGDADVAGAPAGASRTDGRTGCGCGCVSLSGRRLRAAHCVPREARHRLERCGEQGPAANQRAPTLRARATYCPTRARRAGDLRLAFPHLWNYFQFFVPTLRGLAVYPLIKYTLSMNLKLSRFLAQSSK